MSKLKLLVVKDHVEAARALADLVCRPLLAGKKVLWLISGGSSLPIAKMVADLLGTVNYGRLYRYG